MGKLTITIVAVARMHSRSLHQFVLDVDEKKGGVYHTKVKVKVISPTMV